MFDDRREWRGLGSTSAEPHDPERHPEYFEGVLSRRVLACFIDALILAVPAMLAVVFIFLFGLLTFGLGWFLYGLLPPATVVWAVLYYGFTLGSATSATLGMRAMGLEMRTGYGGRPDFLQGAVHAVVFWASVTMLSPFVLLVAFFNRGGRLLHDFVLGAVVVNKEERAAAVRQFVFGVHPLRPL